jgi:ketosteroid isomerase-like protein
MDDAWKRMRSQYELAYRAMLGGDPEPFKALWSHRDDICLFGALGGMEQGWAEVRPRYDWVSKAVIAEGTRIENLLTQISGDVAVAIDLEHMVRTVDGKRIPRTLRVTHCYRKEGGEWRIFHRHGDELRPASAKVG